LNSGVWVETALTGGFTVGAVGRFADWFPEGDLASGDTPIARGAVAGPLEDDVTCWGLGHGLSQKQHTPDSSRLPRVRCVDTS
jgi:hypothetical protein